MVAYDSASGQVVKAWKSALVNQTPSLDNRSQNQSVAKGQEIAVAAGTVLEGHEFNLLHYETQGDSVLISSLVDGVSQNFTISPQGTDSFTVSLH
jgi:hypothetical protein